MRTPQESLTFALDKYGDQVEVVELGSLVMESARQNPKRPAYLKLAVPDELVKSLRGRNEERDLVLLVRVPKQVIDRSESRIVLPGEDG